MSAKEKRLSSGKTAVGFVALQAESRNSGSSQAMRINTSNWEEEKVGVPTSIGAFALPKGALLYGNIIVAVRHRCT
ncbi:MAG: hypothetical protein RhofKO_29340 [Rhodothermales bacterium]